MNRRTRRKLKLLAVDLAMIYLAFGMTRDLNFRTEKPQVRIDIRETNEEYQAPVNEELTQIITEEAVTEPHEKTYDFDTAEAEMLAKLAMAEAGIESTEGKALVINVVLNRVADDSFPDSIEEVIYQKGQFSTVTFGQFQSAEPDEGCLEAVDMVAYGWDESQGATYFESKSDSTWHQDNLEFLFQYEHHFFYKEKGT